MSKVASKLRRTREHLYLLATAYAPRCYVCGEVIDAQTLIQGDSSDGVVWHHVDFDRDHNDPENLALCHRSCHRSFHNAYERGEDIRSQDAKVHWGPTPVNQAPNRKRVGGALVKVRK